MDVSSWTIFSAGSVCTVFGAVGLLSGWKPDWRNIALLVAGVPVIIISGMPIWKCILNFLGSGARAYCDHLNGNDITTEPSKEEK